MAEINSSTLESVKVTFSDGKTEEIKISDLHVEQVRDVFLSSLFQAISQIKKSKCGCYRV